MKLAIVDDSVAIRYGVPQMLADAEIVASYATAEQLLAEEPSCDVVLLDLRLAAADQPLTESAPDRPGDAALQGAAAVRAVAARGYTICLYTDERRPLVLAQCLQAGAAGIAHKSDAPHRLAAIVGRVAAGETVITQSLTALAEVVERAGEIRSLTARQRDVLTARARGEQWTSIALRLSISEPVAREHMAAASAKFADYLHGASPSDLERHLGVGPGDLIAAR